MVDILPGVSGLSNEVENTMSVAVVMKCDINTCKVESKEIKKARMLDKEYDLCPNCYAKLTDFVGRRLEGGRTVPESSSSGTIQIGGGVITTTPWPSPWIQNQGGYSPGGYSTTGYLPLPISTPPPSLPIINSDIQMVFDTILGNGTSTIIDAPEK